MQGLPPFHLAFSVTSLDEARAFYGRTLGCPEGRSSSQWVDFNFFGHQIVAHLAPANASHITNPVDGDDVPVPHFGVVLSMQDFDSLAQRLKKAGVRFVIEPHVRFKGEVGEQATMFFRDPSGNALELKAFRDIGRIFAR